jgi:hypothetical protein
MHSVFIAILLGESAEVSMNFVETTIVLQRQMAFSGASATPCQIEFVTSVNDAVNLFKSTAHTRLVLIDGDVGVDVPFIQKNHPFPVVVASYPVRKIDWERVSSYIMTQRESGNDPDPEEARCRGCIYNFETSTESCIQESYLPIDRAQAKVVSVSRSGVDIFLNSYDAATKTVKRVNDEIVTDLSSIVKNPGPYDFIGVVGRRLLQSKSVEPDTAKTPPTKETLPAIDESTSVEEICY